MYQISEKEWNRVLKRFKNKSEEIDLLNKQIKEMKKELEKQEEANKELKKEKEKLEKENFILLNTQKTLLENLNDSLSLLERYNIKKYKTITSNSLDELV